MDGSKTKHLVELPTPSFQDGTYLVLNAELLIPKPKKSPLFLSFLNKEGGPLAVDGSKTKHLVELPTVFDGPPFFSRRDLFNA